MGQGELQLLCHRSKVIVKKLVVDLALVQSLSQTNLLYPALHEFYRAFEHVLVFLLVSI